MTFLPWSMSVSGLNAVAAPPLTVNLKSAACMVPPLSLTTTFLMIRWPGWSSFVIVQVLVSPLAIVPEQSPDMLGKSTGISYSYIVECSFALMKTFVPVLSSHGPVGFESSLPANSVLKSKDAVERSQGVLMLYWYSDLFFAPRK